MRTRILFLALAAALSSTAVSLADVVASPAPPTLNAPAVAKPSPGPTAMPKREDFADYVARQIRTLESMAAQGQSLNAFAASVYAPYCRAHGGLAKTNAIVLPKPPSAWPATVRCGDGSVIQAAGP